jgi:hypothetical protein
MTITETKTEELKTVIGKSVSHNYSPTLQAKLVKVNKVTCVFEVTKSDYFNDKDYCIGMRFKDNVYRAYNTYFA